MAIMGQNITTKPKSLVLKPLDVIYLACFLSTLVRIQKRTWDEFVIILLIWVEFFTDLSIVLFFKKGEYNTWFYNISMPVQTILYAYYYFLQAESTTKKRVIAGSIVLFAVASVVNYFYIQHSDIMNTLTLIPFEMEIAMLSYMLVRKRVLTDDFRILDMPVLFSIANLVFFTTFIPLSTIEPYLTSVNMNMSRRIFIVSQVSTGIWHVLLTIAFLWKKPTNTYSLSS